MSGSEELRDTPGRGKLTERAYSYIRDGILRGDLPVGSVLTEEEIAEALGHSRTPVRHALGLLLQEGLVEVGARRQLIVRGFTPEHRAELLILREALETVAVRRACETMTIDEIDRLRLLLMRQRRAAASEQEDEFIDLDEEFHLRIAEGARLPILVRFLGQLRGFVRVMRLGTVRHPRHLVQVVGEHEAIVDALEQRDEQAATMALSHHLHTSDYVFERGRTRSRAGER
jgi:GntR family transcriptional regulator, rspAB operon transcriptional repressor